MRAIVALLVLGFASAAPAAEPPAPGSRVRVKASPDGTIRGTLAAIGDESLTLEAKGATAPLVIEKSRITRLEVSAGRRSRGRGAAIGALIGLGTGLLFTASQTSQEAQAESDGLAAAIGLIVVTPLLMGTGALIGVALPPAERWVEAPLPRSPPVRPRAGLRLSIRF